MRVPVLVPMGPTAKVPVRYLMRLSGDDFGGFDPETLTIRISKTRCQTPEAVWATVWHEMAHASLWVSGWGSFLTPKTEEAVVTALEYSIAPFMLFNRAAKGVRWREVAFPFEGE